MSRSAKSSKDFGALGSREELDEVIAELREDDDELVKRIVESFLEYRSGIADYMVYADNGQMNARALDYNYGG